MSARLRTVVTLLAGIAAGGALGKLGAQSAPQAAPLLFRQPAVSATEICFTFGGDIWLVPRAGGIAHRLTTRPATASDCHFSPDGKWIAYTGTRDGNADVYVVPTAGGVVRRLTYHPGNDIARGWTPDGKVLFA